MAKKKPTPVPKKLKAKQKPFSGFKESHKAGFDVQAYVSRITTLGEFQDLLQQVADKVGCPIHKLPDQDLLTIPILEEILEILDGS